MVEETLTHISLFSGGMGLDLGLEQVGFQTLACVEKDAAACQTIRVNAPDIVVKECLVDEVDPLGLLRELGLEPGELYLVSGGPPCQPFSTAGREMALSDPRSDALWDFLRFVEATRPKFFVMENVRGVSRAVIEGEGVSVLETFRRELDEYVLDCFLVNAVSYGAPQLRERLLVFGNRTGAAVRFPSFDHVAPEEVPEDVPGWLVTDDLDLKPWRTLGDALKGLDDPEPEVLDFSPRKKRFLEAVPPGGNWRSLPPELMREAMGKALDTKGGKSAFWRRLSFDLPSPTIVTMPNHASTSLCHPTETRALSVRECARVQEFPDEWEFQGTTIEKYRQIGTAVPVRLGRVAGQAILDAGPRRRGDPPFHFENLGSHVRTRRWFHDGDAVVRGDDE